MNLISCSEAKKQGLVHYYTGKPCKRGHVAKRSVHNGNCSVCSSEYQKTIAKDQYEKHAEKKRAKEQTGEGRIKRLARAKINNAIYQGRLTKQPCQVCGATKWIHAHHDDYNKPFDIMWLCSQHHHDRHRWLKAQADSFVVPA